MQATVTLESEAIPVVKSCLELRRKGLELSLRQYQDRLTAFEERYRMSSEEFAAKFESGQLGDSAEWFEWEFVRDAHQETKRQLGLLARIRI